MTVICKPESMMTCNVQICSYLYCLHLILSLRSWLACTVGLRERHVQVNATLNLSRWLFLTRVACIHGFLPVVPVSKLKVDGMVVLYGGLKLISAKCMWDWLYPVVLWWLGTSHLTYPMYIISCAWHRLVHFICEKSHVLHAPAWILLACHAIFTWLQNLVEPLRSTLTFCFLVRIFLMILWLISITLVYTGYF